MKILDTIRSVQGLMAIASGGLIGGLGGSRLLALQTIRILHRFYFRGNMRALA